MGTGFLWRLPLHLAYRVSREKDVIKRDIQRCRQPRVDPPPDELTIEDVD